MKNFYQIEKRFKVIVKSIGSLMLVVLGLSSLSFAQTTVILNSPGTGSWTVPCGVTSIYVEVYGAGGGGGAGGFVDNVYGVTPGQIFNYSVGTGGSAGTPAGASGGSGAMSTFNGNLRGFGGSGGQGGGSGSPAGAGGIGGSGSLWAGPINGDNGTNGGAMIGGFGGSNNGPNGGAGGIGGAAGIVGQQGAPYGAGGGGGGDKVGSSNPMGGAGADGAVLITFTTTVTEPNAGPDQNACGITNLAGNSPDLGWTLTWSTISGTGTAVTPTLPNSPIVGLTPGGCTVFELKFSMVGCADFVDYVTICEPVICNDDPCGAIPLPVGNSCSYSTYSNVGSTGSTGMQEPGCGSYADNDVWFSAVVPASGQLEINSIDAPGGSTMYQGISIYTGTCNNLQHAGCDVTTSTLSPAEMSFLGTPGQTVYIRVHNYFEYESDFQICAHSTPNAAGDIVPGSTSVTCGTPMTFMDPGGTGNYQVNSSGQYILCPDTPGQYVTIDFSSGSGFFDIESGYDKLTILDGGTNAAPIIGQWSGTNSPGVITSSAPDGCLTIVFQSDNVITDLGWLATVTCNSVAGTNTYVCSATNCSGECGQWICQDGLYPTGNNGNSVEDLAIQTSGCFGSSGEIASHWFYFTVDQGGSIEFTFDGPNGQDYDFAVWGPSMDGIPPCPMNTNDSPVLCSYAAVGNTGNPVGISQALGGGQQYEGAEGDGWVDALNTQPGETYAMILNIYMQGNPQPVIDLTIGGTGTLDCTPVFLPVTLHTFDGINQGNKNLLSWITNVEVNNDYFTVERSINGKDWEVVGMLNGAGNSQERRYYQMYDYTPYLPVSYYRLKQTDIDGESSYSDVISINANRAILDGLISDIFPNPADDYTTFSYNGEAGSDLAIKIVDEFGSVVFENDYISLNERQAITLRTDKLAAGVYQIIASQNGDSTLKRLVIIR